MRAIIVDDEELARSRLSLLLTALENITVCGSFATAAEGLQYLEENVADVVFLDISMPEMDGMEFANRLLELQHAARIVFVTGYEEYAVEAFEVEAVDYLLKPISRERLAKTINRLMKVQPVKGQHLYVSCFGGFRVSVQEDGSYPISWRSPKVEELFALLVCKGTVSRDELADTLWRDFPLDKAMKNLSTTIYYIRRALQQYNLEDCLITTRRQISLNTGKITCDLYEFEKLLKKKRSTEDEIVGLYELYKRELFRGKAYEWFYSYAQEMEEVLISKLLQVAQHEEKIQPEKSEGFYLRGLKLNPYHELAFEKLFNLYMQNGKKNKAVQLRKEIEKLLV